MPRYTVVQDSKYDPVIKLFLLDPACGHRWGQRLNENVRWFETQEHAEVFRLRLRYNNPQVVSEYTARALHDGNARHQQSKKEKVVTARWSTPPDFPEPWDDHKDTF